MHPICHFAYSSIIYCWDEENRLTSYSQSLKRARFSYDASGERYYKNSGASVMSVNNGVWQMMTIYATPTLYTSPYLVATKDGYTKHYYAESERIASKIGGGGLQNLHAVCDELYTDNTSAGSAHVLPRPYAELPELDFEAKRDSSKMHLKRLAGCIGGEMGEIKENILVVLNQYAAGAQASPHSEDECYWYHPDHLGSASWVSDKAGKGIQHLYYLPWGEELDNQRATDYASRYTFSGKERDEETGYSYFGARYYNSDLSIWLSVDPMANKYPSLSPYTYCADNPVKLVDPDGRTWWIGGLQYNPGESCPENVSDFIRDAWNIMNTIYEHEEGKVVIDAMNKDLTSFCICEDAHDKTAYPCYYISDKAIYTNYEDYHGDLLASIAHEMFHGYQDLYGQGGRSWQNEVEAYWFEDVITGNHAFLNCMPLDEGQIKVVNAIGKLQNYSNSHMNSDDFFDSFEAVQQCFPFSRRNGGGVYDRYSDMMNSTILIQQFFELDE